LQLKRNEWTYKKVSKVWLTPLVFGSCTNTTPKFDQQHTVEVKTAHMLERPTKHDLKQYIILETNKPETHSYQIFNPNFKLIQVELILVLITVRTRKSIFCEFLFFAVNCLQLHGLQKNFFFMQICDHYIRILPIFQFWLCKSRLQSKLMVFTRVVYAQLGLTILVKLF